MSNTPPLESTSESPAPAKLVRELGLFSAFCFVAGSVIGSGVFLVASDIAKELSQPFWALSVWVVAGVLSIVGGLIFAELGCAYPKAGGQYVYLRELLHPLVGFLYGWTLVLVIQTGTIAAVAIAFSRFSARLYPMNDLQIKGLATAAIVAFTAFNTLGVKKGAGLLDLLTALKLIALIGISGLGVYLFARSAPGTLAPSSAVGLSSYGVALIAAFWSYDGWNNVTFIAGEMRHPKKHLPKALALGMLTVTAVYFLANLAYYQLLTPEQVKASTFVAADAAEHWGGATAVRGMTILVVLSALGCLNAMVLGGARVIYAMANDNVLPSALAKVNAKTHSPNFALYFQAAWTCLLVWSGRYDQLFTYVVFAAFVFYGLTACALFRLRRRDPQGDPDPAAYRTPLYPWLPAAYVLFVGVFSLNSLMTRPLEALAGLAIILTGVPAYFLFRRPSAESATS